MALTNYLIDTSAVARMPGGGTVASRVYELASRGLVGICDVTRLELGYSARGVQDWLDRQQDLSSLFGEVPTPHDVLETALRMQHTLVKAGTHRGVRLGDLLVAATAHHHHLTVLHYDHDYALLAGADLVQAEWVVAAGSVD